MAAEDIQAQALGWALDEIAKQCLTEAFGVAITFGPAPVQIPPPAPGLPPGVQMVPLWQLLITARNPELGNGPLFHLVPIGNLAQLGQHVRPQEDVVRAAVTDGLQKLRSLAASKLAARNGHRAGAR